MASPSPRESMLMQSSPWKPDSEVFSCMSCGLPFNLINRRVSNLLRLMQDRFRFLFTSHITNIQQHHCRQCGKKKYHIYIRTRNQFSSAGDIFCGKCSSEQTVIPSVSEKPVRVCDCCFDMTKIQNILSKVNQINHLKNTSLTAPDLSATLLSLSRFGI